MSHENIDDLPGMGGGSEEKSWQELGHRLFDKKFADWSTEVKNPDAMATLDTAMLGYIKDEFEGTGLEKDIQTFVNRKSIRWIAKDRARAKETETIASAAARSEEAKSTFREKLLGSLER